MSDRRSTFERIKQSAAYAGREARRLPSTTGIAVGSGCVIAFMAGWCILCSLFTFVFSSVAGWMGIVPGLMTLGGGVALIHVIRKSHQFAEAATEALPAIVVSKHSRGSGEHSSNYITLEFEGDRRKEFRIGNEDAAALVGVGDEGVAFTKLDIFLAFERVP